MSDIYDLQQIRQQIAARCRSNPEIHINVSIARPKLRLTNIPALITGVYPNFFQIETEASGQKTRHTLQYTDVLLHNIEILDIPL